MDLFITLLLALGFAGLAIELFLRPTEEENNNWSDYEQFQLTESEDHKVLVLNTTPAVLKREDEFVGFLADHGAISLSDYMAYCAGTEADQCPHGLSSWLCADPFNHYGSL